MFSLIFRTILCVVVIIAFYIVCKQEGPSSSVSNKGYGYKSESVSTLLSRISWVHKYRQRVDYVSRYFVYSSTLFLLLSTVLNIPPTPLNIFRGLFVCWITLMSFEYFFEHHVNKFPNYYIDRNIRFIRQKLKLSRKPVKLNKKKFNIQSPVWTYTTH